MLSRCLKREGESEEEGLSFIFQEPAYKLSTILFILTHIEQEVNICSENYFYVLISEEPDSFLASVFSCIPNLAAYICIYLFPFPLIEQKAMIVFKGD